MLVTFRNAEYAEAGTLVALAVHIMRNFGVHFRGPHAKDYNTLGSILGSP